MSQLEDMQMFVATVAAGSFTAAAAKLGWSKQFVSRRIMALEARLGVRLLNRSTRRLSVTELGRDYYERAAKILEEVDEAEQAVTSQNAAPRGTLRISAPMSFGTLRLGPALPRFLVRHPELRVELDLNDRVVDLLSEGYDMAIRIGTLQDSSLIARPIAPVASVVCCSPAYLARRGAPATPDELEAHDCLLYGHGRSVDWLFQENGKTRAVPVSGCLRVNNGELARDAAIAGLGIALQPDFIVRDALEAGELVTVLDRFVPPPGVLSAVYPRHRQGSLAIRACVEFLQETFGR